MLSSPEAALHDAYAVGYDDQVAACDCHLADVMFGMCYEFIQPGQRLLDLGIGSGLTARLFARAGLEVYGTDFSPAMLDVCRAKGFAVELQQHDLQQVPWPYASHSFDHLVCCGVLHFIPDLEVVFTEAERLLRQGGLFAFTTKAAPSLEPHVVKYSRQTVGEFEVFAQAQTYVETLLARSFRGLKTQKCLVGDAIFNTWIVSRV